MAIVSEVFWDQILDEQTLLALEDHVLYLFHYRPRLIHQAPDVDIQSVVLRELVLQVWKAGVEDRELVVGSTRALLLDSLRVDRPSIQIVLLDVLEILGRNSAQDLVNFVIYAILLQVLE